MAQIASDLENNHTPWRRLLTLAIRLGFLIENFCIYLPKLFIGIPIQILIFLSAMLTVACIASVSSARGANCFFGRARIGRAQKRNGGGRGGKKKETLADKPLDFENSRSLTNGVSDWRGSDFLSDISCQNNVLLVASE